MLYKLLSELKLELASNIIKITRMSKNRKLNEA